MMELLPLEMLLEIAQYLTAEDLATCCAVSRGWRDIFSHDALWQPRCDPSLEEYLRTTPCTVEPGFVSPEGEDSTLSPVGHWRLAFMRENHLWNNWQQDNYKSDQRKITRDSKFGFLGNDTVLLINGGGSIDLWNMFTMKEKRSHLKCLCNTHYTSVSSSCGILIRSSGVQVVFLHEETKDLVIKFIFFFDESEKLMSNSEDVFKCRYGEKYGQICKFNEHVYAVSGTVFVGSLPNDSNLHVWDLESGNKLKTEKCSLIGDSNLIHIKHSLSSEIIILIFRSNHECNTVVYTVYSLKQLSFLPFRLSTTYKEEYNVRRCAVHKHYVALIDPADQLSVYNCLSTDLIYRCPINGGPLGIIDNSFIFNYQGCTHAFSPTDRKCSKIFNCYFFRDINQRVLKLHGTGNNTFIGSMCFVGLIKRSTFKEVLIENHLCTASFHDTINHSSTRLLTFYNRMAINSGISIHCFW